MDSSDRQHNRKRKRKKEKRRKEEKRKEKRRKKGIRATEGNEMDKDDDYASDCSLQSCDTIIISQNEPEIVPEIVPEILNEEDPRPRLVRTHAIWIPSFRIKEE
jgi:hypothetical protein